MGIKMFHVNDNKDPAVHVRNFSVDGNSSATIVSPVYGRPLIANTAKNWVRYNIMIHQLLPIT